jgi:hypothetical protein
MQCAIAIPVTGLGSGSCQPGLEGWILMKEWIMYLQFKAHYVLEVWHILFVASYQFWLIPSLYSILNTFPCKLKLECVFMSIYTWLKLYKALYLSLKYFYVMKFFARREMYPPEAVLLLWCAIWVFVCSLAVYRIRALYLRHQTVYCERFQDESLKYL